MIRIVKCACGCGELVPTNGNQAKPRRIIPECRRRIQSERQLAKRQLERDTRTNLTAREVSPHPVRLNTDPAHKPSKHCPVCAGLSERRAETCSGCGLPWAPERAETGRVVLRSSAGLALTG